MTQNLLLIDPSPRYVGFVHRLFSELDVRVTSGANFTQGLDLVNQDWYDLVIFEPRTLYMPPPEGNLVEFLSYVRSEHQEYESVRGRIPLIASTNEKDMLNAEFQGRYGIDAILQRGPSERCNQSSKLLEVAQRLLQNPTAHQAVPLLYNPKQHRANMGGGF
jgi:CheY-like chemotaxis protein